MITYLASSSIAISSWISLKFDAFIIDDVDPLPSTALLNSSFISSFPKPSELTKIPPVVDFASDVTISVLTPFGVFVIVTFTKVEITGGCLDDWFDVADIVVVLAVVGTSVVDVADVVDGVTSGGDVVALVVGICSKMERSSTIKKCSFNPKTGSFIHERPYANIKQTKTKIYLCHL